MSKFSDNPSLSIFAEMYYSICKKIEQDTVMEVYSNLHSVNSVARVNDLTNFKVYCIFNKD